MHVIILFIGDEGEQRPIARASQEKGWPQAGSRPGRAGEIHSGAAVLKNTVGAAVHPR